MRVRYNAMFLTRVEPVVETYCSVVQLSVHIFFRMFSCLRKLTLLFPLLSGPCKDGPFTKNKEQGHAVNKIIVLLEVKRKRKTDFG